MARALALFLALLALPLATLAAAAPGVAQCDDVVVSAEAPAPLELSCPGGVIRPGAAASGCTINFVLTDGVDLYVGSAGHCGGVGKRWSMTGVGAFGTTVFSEFQGADILNLRDWSLIRIDPEDRARVDPTMARWGGPITPAPGIDARPAAPGDVVLMFGNGAGLGQEDATRGRVGAVAALLGTTAFAYPGTVGGGDSGSPIRFATGEPAGIAVAGAGIVTGDNRGFVAGSCAAIDALSGDATDTCIAWDTACPLLEGACVAPFRPGGIYGAVVATRFDAALAAFEAHLGRDLEVVDGRVPALVVG